MQVGGSINDVSDVTPESLQDPREERYLWYDDDLGIRRPAPLQAALAQYLGNNHVRLDSETHLRADVDQGIVRQIFHCPADEQFRLGLMIGSFTFGWSGVRLPSSYAYNEGGLGFEANSSRRRHLS